MLEVQDYYMAHPFDSRDDVRPWELHLEKKFGITILNPFYDTERTDIQKIDEGRQERYQVPAERIVIPDLHCIQRCRATIASVTGDLSYGTIMEIVYAHIYHKPVFIIVTNGHEQHPWLTFHATKIFTSREQFEVFLEAGYGPSDFGGLRV